jgi:hypothetical protein
MLWIRGILRGRVHDDLEGALRSVVLGIAPVAIAAATTPLVHGPESFGALAIGYVLLGLLVLALYRIGEPARPVAAVAAQWGALTAVVAAAAVGLTAVAAAIDPGAFGPVGRIGELLRGPAILVAEWVIGPPLRGLAWLIGLLIPDGSRSLPPPQLEPQQEPERERDENEPAWALPVRWLIGGAITMLVVFGALLLIALLFRRFSRPPDEGDSRTDIERDGTLADDLGDLLGALGRRFRRSSRPAPSAIAIRRLYARVLDHAAAGGLVRPAHATPGGFAPRLDARYGSPVPGRISELFASSRYGAHEIDDAVVGRLALEWDETIRRSDR